MPRCSRDSSRWGDEGDTMPMVAFFGSARGRVAFMELKMGNLHSQYNENYLNHRLRDVPAVFTAGLLSVTCCL